MPKISIIMPVYNAAATVDAAVKSVLGQTFEEFELIAVDDGSKDESLQQLKNIAREDNRLKVLSQPNAGPSAARNTGLDAAQGDYIAFIDADDAYTPDALEIFFKYIQEFDWVCAGFAEVRGDTILGRKGFCAEFSERTETLKNVSKMMDEGYFNQLWNKCYKAEIIRNSGLRFDSEYDIGEDLLFNIRYAAVADSLVCIDTAVYRYTVLSGGLTQKYREKRFETLKSIALQLSLVLEKNGLDDKQAQYFAFKSMFGCFTLLFDKNFFGDKKGYVIDKLSDDYVRSILSKKTFFTSRLMKILYKLAKKKKAKTILFLARINYIKKRRA